MTNSDIVACARGWLGTRFHHQGRLKKSAVHRGGVDCLGLLIGIAKELQLSHPGGQRLSDFDEINYPHYPDTRRFRQRLAEALRAIPVAAIEPGDVLLLRIDDNPQHLAIVSDRKTGHGIIHAYAPARSVVEHDLNEWWQSRIESAFRY
jgi:hypothetical protein